MSPPSNPLPIYSWPPPSSSNPSNVQNNSTIPSKFPLLGQQKQFINGYSSPSNLATTNCMSPLAALQQQFEQKQRGPWHRRLSPLKKKTSSSSFSSARPLATSSSISPQRRPPSPEKRQRPVPIYQQMNGAKNGGGTFQEAWEHLSRQCAASISEQSRLPLHVHSMPPSPTKSSSGQMPLPNSPPSTSNSSPLEMPDSINPIGRALPTALSNDGQKNGTMTESTTLALAPSSSCETMSSSILASPAWYRDRDGRTGYRPDDFPHGARVQNSPIKVIPTAFKKNGIDENKSTKQQIASSTLQRPPNPPIIRQEQRHNQSVEASPIRPIRHSSTLPLPSSSNKQKHISPSFHHFHGLPPIGPNNGNGAPPFPLRRTQHAINVNSGMANSERAKHDWFIRNGTNDGAQKGEEMAQLMKTSIQSQQSMASTTTQKVVKFAETVQINEIAPRGELESSLCSSTSSSSNSSSCPSSASNSSSSDEEDRQNRPKTNGNSSMNFAGRNQEISLPKRTVTSPPLAVVRPRTTTKISMEMKNGIEGYTENGQQKGIIAENGHRKLQNVHPETAELERVIEQFFQHCQSLSSLNPAANAEQNQQTQNQSQSQPNLLISPQSPIQQRSVYDNLGDEEGANADWLHTKAKVIGQQNLGPSIGIWARDGSPKRRVEVTVTTTTTTSNPTTNSGTNNNNNGRSMAIIGGSAPYSVQTLPLTNLPLANRKSNSMDPPISRIPLARPSATIRPTGGGGHHSGSESSSSCSSSSTGQLIKGRPRLGSNPTMSNQKHSFAVLKKRRMKP